jgi:hypothetical protein
VCSGMRGRIFESSLVFPPGQRMAGFVEAIGSWAAPPRTDFS